MFIAGIMAPLGIQQALDFGTRLPDGVVAFQGCAIESQATWHPTVDMRVVLGSNDVRATMTIKQAEHLRATLDAAIDEAYQCALSEACEELEALSPRNIQTTAPPPPSK